MTDRMDRHEHDDLKTYGTIFQVLTVIAGIVLAVVGVSYLVTAADTPGTLARATQVTGWTYLAYALTAVISGQFVKAVTAWMTAMYANLADLKAKVADLEATTAQPPTAPTTRPRVPAPLNESRYPRFRLPRTATNDREPVQAIRSDTTLTCSNCGYSFAATPSATWHACPNCQAPFKS